MCERSCFFVLTVNAALCFSIQRCICEEEVKLCLINEGLSVFDLVLEGMWENQDTDTYIFKKQRWGEKTEV